jgi:hypothetical protein
VPLLLDPSAGLITQTLQEILSEVNARLQELGGADLDALDASTPEGLICGVLAERELLLQGGLHDALDALSVDRAQGAQLQALARSVGIEPIEASFSTIAVVVGGTPGSTAAGNKLVRNAGPGAGEGALWRLPASVTVGISGFVASTLTAVEAGSISGLTTDSWEFVQLDGTLDSVVATADAVEGEDDETDPDLRARILRTTSTAAGTEPALEAAMLAVPGVTLESKVYVNRTLAIDANGLGPKSVEFVVVGGDEEDIVNMAYTYASTCAAFSGTTTVAANTYDGVPVEVRYSRVEDVALEVEVDLYTSGAEVDLPADYADQTEAAVVGVELTVGRDAAPARYQAPIAAALPEGSYNWAQLGFRLKGGGGGFTTTYAIGVRERAVVEAEADVAVTEIP